MRERRGVGQRRLLGLVAAVCIGLLATGVESATAATAAAGRVEPQCSGDFYAPRWNDQSVAEELMAGNLTLEPFGTWRLPDDPAWNEDPFYNRSWLFLYHAMNWADPLRRVGLATDNQAMLDRYTALMKDWLADNPITAAASSMSWYDMGTGMRAIGLTCLAATYDEPPSWVLEAIDQHAAALSDPALYASLGNHGLHQNMGLLALGCSQDVSTWRDLAVQRASDLLTRSVDEQGVTDEGSILYQYFNYVWYGSLAHQLDLCGLPRIPQMDRVARMPDFLGFATQPDGNLVAFGDTEPVQRSSTIAGTVSEYATTEGRQGPKPDRTFAVYHRGYAFSRSGWFDTQTADEQSLASLRFGPPKSTAGHAHEDAGNLGYFAYGSQILWQPGRWGGAGGPPRRYVISNDAHNTVDIAGTRYDARATTPLVAAVGSKTADVVTVASRVLKGAHWRRSMVHVKGPEMLVVDDRISQGSSRAVLQRWQLGTDRKVRVSGCGRVDTSGPGSNETLLWFGECPRLSVAVGQRSPLLGWRSPEVNMFVPAPTVVARESGRTVRMTTIIVPRPAGVGSSAVRLLSSRVDGDRGVAEIRVGGQVHRVAFTPSSANVRAVRSPSRTVTTVEPGSRGPLGLLPFHVRVRVSSVTGRVATGRVVIRIGRHEITGRLRNGMATVRVPRLAKGRYQLRATYPGDSAVRPSRSPVRTIVVATPRH